MKDMIASPVVAVGSLALVILVRPHALPVAVPVLLASVGVTTTMPRTGVVVAMLMPVMLLVLSSFPEHRQAPPFDLKR